MKIGRMKLSDLAFFFLAFSLVCILSFSIITGCKGYKPVGGGGGIEDPADPVDPEDPEDPNKITYAKVRATVFRLYCLQCHNSDTGFGGVDVSTYAKAKLAGERLCESVIENKMPPAEQLPIALRDDLCEWVSSGFPVS